ncbi:MAG: nucleotide exchange factor GrpE [Pseudomonadota bacterium]
MTQSASQAADPGSKADPAEEVEITEAAGATAPGEAIKADAAEIDEASDGADDDQPTATDERDEKIKTLEDRVIRIMADMENLRRRAEREKTDAHQFAVTGFARDLLSAADNMRRALESVPEAAREDDTLTSFLSGVEMTERELLNAFEKHGVKRIEPEGEKFDHNFHQAMFEVNETDAPSGTILQVLQPGYTLNGRLLRAAMVGVARPKSAKPQGVDTKV